MTVTRDEMARKEDGSRVRFRVTIPTNMLGDCISTNFGPYPRLSRQSFWEHKSLGLFWRVSSVRVGILTGVGDKLLDFTIAIYIFIHVASYVNRLSVEPVRVTTSQHGAVSWERVCLHREACKKQLNVSVQWK